VLFHVTWKAFGHEIVAFQYVAHTHTDTHRHTLGEKSSSHTHAKEEG